MKNELICGTIGTAVSAVGTSTQTNEVLQTISLIITIVGALLTYIVVPLIMWYKKSNKDGKIEKEEIKEGLDIISKGAMNVKETLDKKKGEDQ